ncbi:MAG: AAA family ATPase [Deltaproteobacteria bacterium]|nr:AAA family ATPase [Deltaproteobacteria bacterium]
MDADSFSKALEDAVCGLACRQRDDGNFREALNGRAKILRHGDCCVEEWKNIHRERLVSKEVKALAGLIKLDVQKNRKVKSPEDWDLEPLLDEEVRHPAKFNSGTWSTALYLLHPCQVYKLYARSLTRVNDLKESLKQAMRYLEEQIDMLVCGAVAQEPVLFLGPPGSGKTRTAVEFFSRLGLTEESGRDGGGNGFFQYLLTKFTTPEEICGSFNIPAMYEGRMVRGQSGSITAPGVRAAFIDEVFKANSPILHSLLTLLSDRRFHSEGRLAASDLAVIILAANDPPYNDVDSAAIYDRMGVRLHFPEISVEPDPGPSSSPGSEPTTYGKDNSRFLHVVERAWRREGFQIETSHGNLSFDKDDEENAKFYSDLYSLEKKKERWSLVSSESHASINDILLLSRAMCLAPYDSLPRGGALHPFQKFAPTDGFMALFEEMVRELYHHPYCRLSGRKLKILYKLARCHAVFRNKGLAGPTEADCAVFKHVWESPEVREDFVRGLSQYLPRSE